MIERLFFHQPEATRRLALVRRVLGAVVLALVVFGPYGSLFAREAWLLYTPSGFLRALPALGSLELVGLRVCAGMGALALLAGARGRTPALVTALSFFMLNGYVSHFTTGFYNYDTHLNFFLFALLLPSDEEHASFALGFMQAWIALLYLQAFMAKILFAGVGWYLRGDVLLLEALRIGTPFGRWLSRFPKSFPALSLATGFVELIAPILFVMGRRYARWGAALVVAFHLGVWLVLDISFWHLVVLLPFIFPADARLPSPTPAPAPALAR